jgi:tetratricopeptide (TPR) repeat protein
METAWRRALELQPDHVLALGSFALTLCARQRLDEALPLFARAREADPLASFPYTLTGWGFLTSGKPAEGLRYVEDALTFEKEDATAICASSIANVALGRFEAGIGAGEHGVAVARRAPFFCRRPGRVKRRVHRPLPAWRPVRGSDPRAPGSLNARLTGEVGASPCGQRAARQLLAGMLDDEKDRCLLVSAPDAPSPLF